MDRQHLANLSPPDAVVALRSFVRRFGDTVRPADLTGDVPLSTVVHHGWSVEGLLRVASGQVARLGDGLRRGLDSDNPALAGDLLDRPVAGAAGAGRADGGDLTAGATPDDRGTAIDVRAHLTAIEAAFAQAADRAARTPSKDWDRPVTIGARSTTVHEVLRELVAYGRSALDDLAATVEAARRHTS